MDLDAICYQTFDLLTSTSEDPALPWLASTPAVEIVNNDKNYDKQPPGNQEVDVVDPSAEADGKKDASFEDMTDTELNYAISRFVCEVGKANGDDYPGQTLHDLVIELQLYLEQQGNVLKLLSDDRFVCIRNTLEHVMKERSAAGLGTEKVEVVTHKENFLLNRGILGLSKPHRVLDTFVYLMGLNFALRAGIECRNLRWEYPQLNFGLPTGKLFLSVTRVISSRKVRPKEVRCSLTTA